MRRPDYTKTLIIEKAAALFNVNGYKATSISQITSETQLTKGAIYRHFKNKAALEKAAFQYMRDLVVDTLRTKIKAEKTAPEKIKSLFTFFETYVSKPIIKGGCPILNAAIESDDANMELKAENSKTLNILNDTIIYIFEKGIEHNQIINTIETKAVASVILSALEGAIMVSKLTDENIHMKYTIGFLEKILEDYTC